MWQQMLTAGVPRGLVWLYSVAADIHSSLPTSVNHLLWVWSLRRQTPPFAPGDKHSKDLGDVYGST